MDPMGIYKPLYNCWLASNFMFFSVFCLKFNLKGSQKIQICHSGMIVKFDRASWLVKRLDAWKIKKGL